MCGVCGCGDGEIDQAAHDHGEHGHAHGHDHADGDRHHHDHGHGHSHTHAPTPRVAESDVAKVIRLEHAILEKNAQFATWNRGYFRGRDIVAVNFLSSPGAGKTALLERLARDHATELRLAVIEADLATDRDAERIRAAGAPVIQVNTGAVCHLDAHMLGHALESLDPKTGSLLAIENVGNLVCPAMFDLGERARVVVFSVTEGEDKPIKYPHMFARADVVILNKMDLAPHVDFDEAAARGFLEKVAPRARILAASARTGMGVAELAAYLGSLREEPKRAS